MRTILLLIAIACINSLAAEGAGSAVSPQASEAGSAWHEGWMLEALGVAGALVLAFVLWMVRKILAAGISIVVVLVAAALLLLAIFGSQLGIYDMILDTNYADPNRPKIMDKVEEQVDRIKDGDPSWQEWNNSQQ